VRATGRRWRGENLDGSSLLGFLQNGQISSPRNVLRSWLYGVGIREQEYGRRSRSYLGNKRVLLADHSLAMFSLPCCMSMYWTNLVTLSQFLHSALCTLHSAVRSPHSISIPPRQIATAHPHPQTPPLHRERSLDVDNDDIIPSQTTLSRMRFQNPILAQKPQNQNRDTRVRKEYQVASPGSRGVNQGPAFHRSSLVVPYHHNSNRTDPLPRKGQVEHRSQR
jgi:hypothetical protein